MVELVDCSGVFDLFSQGGVLVGVVRYVVVRYAVVWWAVGRGVVLSLPVV